MQIRICVTGGISSGKSTVCKFIEELGYVVYYSDIQALKIANGQSFIRTELINEFGFETYINGVYNTKYIASIVFSDNVKLQKLNEIFSDYLEKNFKDFCNLHKDRDIIFYESALIFEHNKQDLFDKVICVYADIDIIKARLKTRNNYNDDEINKRISSQMDITEKIKLTPYLINTNNGLNKEDIIKLINNK